MSAGICIMNRNAIAMAADSAVTVGDHVAIHNSANKLFSLSKVAPVGVIIYANGALMDVPVEIIVKEYKKNLKTRSYPSLQEYVDDFISYLEGHCDLFRFPLNEEKYVLAVFVNLIQGLGLGYKQFLNEMTVNVGGRELNESELQQVAKQAVDQTISFVEHQNKVPEFSFTDYIEKNYRAKFREMFENTPEYKWLSVEQIETLLDKIADLYDTEFERNGYVGIAIAGFGDAEIFPHMVHIHLSGIINGKARYIVKEKVEITEQNVASIVPLAQTDVMQTFLFGLNDQFINDLAREIPTRIHESINNLDANCFAPGKKDEVHKELNGVTEKILQHMTETAQTNYMIPIIQSVATLPIEELALLAESMINITSVRRKVAIDRNIGTVGGPIDVSIISKGDGFIWLKRKHYFERKYNPQFFYSHYESGKESETENDKLE